MGRVSMVWRGCRPNACGSEAWARARVARFHCIQAAPCPRRAPLTLGKPGEALLGGKQHRAGLALPEQLVERDDHALHVHPRRKAILDEPAPQVRDDLIEEPAGLTVACGEVRGAF